MKDKDWSHKVLDEKTPIKSFMQVHLEQVLILFYTYHRFNT